MQFFTVELHGTALETTLTQTLGQLVQRTQLVGIRVVWARFTRFTRFARVTRF